MADIVKLKKKAADLEAKKQLDKALATYQEVIAAYESGEEDPIDIPLFNRVGDLAQKAGNLPEAVSLWEKAVDHYTEGGFYNPAIALCNKILRASPGRTVIYYKLGKISAEKGFKADARENFLEYAGRQQKAGNLNDAFKALKEFADLVPGQHDVRLMLADQLVKAERKDEALEQLQLGYQQTGLDGDTEAGEKFVAKMKEIDPSVEPRGAADKISAGGGGLVFLDVDGSAAPKKKAPAEIKRASKAVAGLELLEPVPDEAPPRLSTKTPTPSALQPPAPVVEPPPTPTDGLEIIATDVGADVPPPPRGSMLGLESTSLVEDAVAEADEVGEPAEVDEGAETDLAVTVDATADEAETTDGTEATETADAVEIVDVPEDPSTVDLPLMDLDAPAARPSVEVAGLIEMEPTLSDSDAPSAAEIPLLEVESSFGEPSATTEAPMLIDSVPGEDSASLLDAEPEAAEEAEELEPVERSTELASTVGSLRERVEATPEDWSLHRQLAEALLESGARDDGLAELETSMAGFEAAGDLDTAGSIAEEIVRLEPKSIRFHQKRVEFAFRANDRSRLAEAYVELADALLADGQGTKARAVYQRVLDIRPDDLRAQAAIESIPEEAEPVAPAPRRTTSAPKAAAAKPVEAKKDDDDEYVSLGDWLREDDEPKSTRMVVEEKEPTGDEQADFNDMLRKFKQGVSDNVDDEDHEAHYDLGVAYKEMGLLDEAIAEFQKALRGTKERVRTFEALGHCFVEKGQLPVASTILQRALSEPGVRDESLIGVLYQLGTIAEQLGAFQDAKKHFERVFAVDIQFRDIGERLNAVEQQLQ